MASVDVNYRIIGLHISTYRHRLNLTQDQLAEKAGLSKQFIGNIECGKAIPSLKTLLSLCDALDVTPNDLLSYSASHNADSPCTLREDHNAFSQTISDQLFPDEPKLVYIDPDDLPAFDIVLSDLND